MILTTQGMEATAVNDERIKRTKAIEDRDISIATACTMVGLFVFTMMFLC